MVVGEASIHNIMGGMESTGGVRLHNHKRKLKQRFDIIKKLGQGTYGKVQLGINKETGQEVAIKTIKKCKIETEADLIRIRREIQIMSSVQHPNIIHIYEVFENREKMVLVMEYAAGGELYDYLSERKVLSELEARRIFRQISTAVFYCHKHKICHRDLKLENILLDQNGNAKIADFGLSNVFDEQRLLSTFCGSPLYASPEIVKGTPYHGPEVDCWSLGVLLYTLVYGAMPFDGSNFKRLVKQISLSDYFEPKKPSPASPLIKDMLTVCPARRADIEKICTHWWVNEGYEQNCLDIAEDLAAQTPVRLDLLLSLVPQSASADKLVVGNDQAPQPTEIANSMSTETLVPTRCHSVGSLMELDQNNSDRRIREMVEEEAKPAIPTTTTVGDAKRKLETTPSMDETTAAAVKKKERTRRKDGTEDRDPKAYRSASKHHSAPIPNSILEEAMEVDPAVIVSVPTSKTVDINKVEDSASCLEVKQEYKEKSPQKEPSKIPDIPTEPQNLVEDIAKIKENAKDQIVENNASDTNASVSPLKPKEQDVTQLLPTPSSPEKISSQVFTEDEKKYVPEVPKDKSPTKLNESVISNSNTPVQKEIPKPTELSLQPKEIKKLKNKALSLDSDLITDEAAPKPSTERRRSKIFETAEKFNQLASPVEPEKPKKIFIPGVNVGGAKLAFERKASLSSATVPQTVKAPVSKVIIDVPTVDKKPENEKPTELDLTDRERRRSEEKKRAVDIITGALGKPPMQRKPSGGSPPISPQSTDGKKLGLKIPLGPNDLRNATVTVSTPVETKFPFETKPELQATGVPVSPDASIHESSNSLTEEPKKCSKVEITLKSATLPRPRKTSKAEITLSGVRPADAAFRSEVEARIDAFHPQKLRTQRSEIAFPVAAAVPQNHRSASLEPEGQAAGIYESSIKERIIPIQVEPIPQHATVHSTTPPPKPPMPQRSMSQRSGSLSRQSTADSDTDSALGSTLGPEPIRKSPREYIIPIAVEGGGYVTPRSGSVEPESKNSTPTSTNPPRSRFGRPRRMGSLLSDASEDESPFSSLHRDNDDLLQRHMHRLRSSRPRRQAPEHADSLSSGEDDDDDGFELLTAENLFSTLLSRVRSLTQRLNVDDNRSTGFPSSRLLGRLGSNSPQGFWGVHEPLSRRISDAQFRRSLSRENNDRFIRKESSGPNSPSSQQNSPGARTPSRDSLFDMGNNTLPRAKLHRASERRDQDSRNQPIAAPAQSAGAIATASSRFLPESEAESEQENLERRLTPCLARRLSRQFIERTRQTLPRSPSLPRERSLRRSPSRESAYSSLDAPGCQTHLGNNSLERYRSRSHDRGTGMRRANSLLEPRFTGQERRSPRRSISLFEDEDNRYLPPVLPRQPIVPGLGRKYRDSGKLSTSALAVEKIQEEQMEECPLPALAPTDVQNHSYSQSYSLTENNSLSECPSLSVSNCLETTSSRSAISGETSPTESTSNIPEYGSAYRGVNNHVDGSGASPRASKDLQTRLLAAENLIRESQLKNLGMSKYNLNPNSNLASNYKDLDKCDKESLGAISESASAAIAKRRSCIPSLRLRSGSLTRDSSLSRERNKPYLGSEDAISLPPERSSLLSKFFRSSSGSSTRDSEPKPETKPRQRRISRFLRPDFFDTPREESQYVKEKEARKAAENERRKSRFMKRKTDLAARLDAEIQPESVVEAETKSLGQTDNLDKQLKNEVNSLTRGMSDGPNGQPKFEPSRAEEESKVTPEKFHVRNSFLQTLEKKLEKFRSIEDSSSKGIRKLSPISPSLEDNKLRTSNENSAKPVEIESSASVRRTNSVEDLSAASGIVSNQSPAKSRVNSVLGLFKNNAESKTEQNGSPRTQGQTILSMLRKNTYKGSRSDSVLTADASTSKIPTKLSKVRAKSTKDAPEPKKSPEKTTTLGFKRSPSKDKDKEKEKEKEAISPKRVSPETKKTMERFTISLKKSPEKMMKNKSEKAMDLQKDGVPNKPLEKKRSPESSGNQKKTSSPEKVPIKAKSPTMIVDNKQVDNTLNGDTEDKGTNKLNKKLTSPLSPLENNTSVKSDKLENGKKIKKVVKTKDAADKEKDKEGSENTKKKRIVRVVRKVVKKSSDSSGNKGDEKDKPTTKVSVKKPSITKTDKNVESSTSCGNIRKNSPEDPIVVQNESAVEDKVVKEVEEMMVCKSMENDNYERSSKDKVESESTKTERRSNSVPKVSELKPNKDKLKLDFSKIPQHNFRNVTPPRKESPKSETPKSEISEIPRLIQTNQLDNASGKLIVGSKTVKDKLSPVKCGEDLNIESRNDARVTLQKENSLKKDNSVGDRIDEENKVQANSIINPLKSHEANEEKIIKLSNASLKDPLSTEDLLSPTEDTESFDSWSICSADINHTRGELHSPTSPTYSLYMRSDTPRAESVVDRIRRKSFYSRFNDRKRKASLNAPPPSANMSSSMTLPRKFSFNATRETGKDQKNKSHNYTLPARKNREKCYSMYNDDLPSSLFRKSPIERDRYSDGGSTSSYSNDLKSPNESYGHISSSYDPLRKYLSPTFDSNVPRRKYHSTEFSTDNDLGSYKNASFTDSVLEPNSTRNNSTLPRRYGSSTFGFEPKTVEYYEGLLAPNNTDYLGGRRVSPLPHENYNKFENGYHNGSLDLPQFNVDKWKTHSDKVTEPDHTEELQIEDRPRKVSQYVNEPDDISTNSLDQREATSTIE